VITYVPINLSNRRFYIGSTNDFPTRWRGHRNSKNNYPFQNALKKSSENFFVLISEDDGLETREEEQFYLNFYHGLKQCYNISKDASAPMQGRTHTEDTKELLSVKLAGEGNPNYGNKWKWEWSDAQISAVNKRPHGEEHHWSSAHRDITGSNNPFFGRNHTEESKEKNRLAHTGVNNPCTGTKWWVNEKGETLRGTQSPGKGWVPGRKWKN
jgi:group I intron endonuclease